MSALEKPAEPPREECPACGGSGGGPFGRAGSGWDVETYECPRCEGWGYIRAREAGADDAPIAPARPGIAKTAPRRESEKTGEKKKRARG